MKQRLKIGLDVLPMHYPYSGVRTYVEALIDAYRNRDIGIELVPLASTTGLTRSFSRLAQLMWDVRGVAESAALAQVDMLHMTRFAAPHRFARPLVVTVHDLIPLQLAEYQASPQARIQSALAARCVSTATRVIVPSRYVAGVVEELLGYEPNRIDVVPMGVAAPPAGSSPRLIEGPYILHTGGFDARKNLAVLLRAFSRAQRNIDGDWRLVLVGAPHRGNAIVYPPIVPLIKELGLEHRVVLTGRVSEREKHALYQHAAFAVSPSLSEGFGLPILEAMARGVPVIASNRTSHPEVAGDAALLVEPTEDAIDAAIVRLASNQALRAELSVRGRDRAALFPWSRTAAATVETYRRALDHHSV
jgi:glycosyltransferase involved in cell wall biosynthesis